MYLMSGCCPKGLRYAIHSLCVPFCFYGIRRKIQNTSGPKDVSKRLQFQIRGHLNAFFLCPYVFLHKPRAAGCCSREAQFQVRHACCLSCKPVPSLYSSLVAYPDLIRNQHVAFCCRQCFLSHGGCTSRSTTQSMSCLRTGLISASQSQPRV